MNEDVSSTAKERLGWSINTNQKQINSSRQVETCIVTEGGKNLFGIFGEDRPNHSHSRQIQVFFSRQGKRNS